MLCVTIRKDERLQIGEATLVYRGGGGMFAKIGIEAPAHVEVIRESAKCKEPRRHNYANG